MLKGCTRMGRKMQTGPPKSGSTGSSGLGTLGVKLSCRSGGAWSAPSRVCTKSALPVSSVVLGISTLVR